MCVFDTSPETLNLKAVPAIRFHKTCPSGELGDVGEDSWWSRSARPGGWHSGWGGDESGGRKQDFTDPPKFPGWQYYRPWKKSVMRWDDGTDHPLRKRAGKVLAQLDWDLQAKLENLPEGHLADDTYLMRILEVLDNFAGEKPCDEERRAVRAAFFDTAQKRDETLSQCVLAGAAVRASRCVRGRFPRQHEWAAGGGRRPVGTLTGGATSWTSVSQALRHMDPRGAPPPRE